MEISEFNRSGFGLNNKVTSRRNIFFLPRVETRGIIEARDSETVTETKGM